MPAAIDPRLAEFKPFRPTVNQAIVARSIRHAVMLERFKNHEVRRILELLEEDVIPDLEGEVSRRMANIATRGLEANTFANVRLGYLLNSTKAILATGMLKAKDELTKGLVSAAITERDFQRAMVKSLAPVELDFTLPSVETMRSIVVSRPFEGRLLRQWFSDLGAQTQTKLSKQVSIGIVQGESVDQMVRRVRGTKANGFKDGVIGGLKREVESVVRTATQHVVNHARAETYLENEDVVSAYQWRATLDSRTCLRCAKLDGVVFKLGGKLKLPPLHLGGCRCTTVPVLKSWKELGIDLEEAPAGVRASMDGEVPESMTYGEWLRTQSKEVQEEVLGKAKAALFRGNKVTIEDFVDPRGRELTIRQLRAKAGLKPIGS